MLDWTKLEDGLEVCWLEAKDRGDKRGEVLALVGLVELHLTEHLDRMSHQLVTWTELLPLKAEGHWGLEGPQGTGRPRGRSREAGDGAVPHGG